MGRFPHRYGAGAVLTFELPLVGEHGQEEVWHVGCGMR